MQTEPFETPVALFVFRRPDTTRRVFEAICRIRPSKLLLIADGPRPNRQGEAEVCQRVREIVSQIDWPCEVFKNFSSDNLGCEERMVSGLSWVFSLVEEAILLEDDCLPDPTFFKYCSELLERYRGDSRVSYISGSNLMQTPLPSDASYYFSRIGGIWGWASWRSEWQRYDRQMKEWPRVKSERLLFELFPRSETAAYYTRVFDAMYEKRGPDTWDYQWLYTGLINNSLAIVPKVNLITNIGYTPDATHPTAEPDTRWVLPTIPIEFPLKHPPCQIALAKLDYEYVKATTSRPFFTRFRTKARRILRTAFHR